MTGYVGSQTVPVFCWCGLYTVDVHLDEVRAGLTKPCRLRDCIAIDNQKRKKS